MTQSYRDYSERNVSQLPQYKRIVLRLFLFLWRYGGKAPAPNSFERGREHAGSTEKREEVYGQHG